MMRLRRGGVADEIRNRNANPDLKRRFLWVFFDQGFSTITNPIDTGDLVKHEATLVKLSSSPVKPVRVSARHQPFPRVFLPRSGAAPNLAGSGTRRKTHAQSGSA